MIDITAEIESFLWTGNRSAKAIIAKTLKKAAEADEPLYGS